jgi:hypothetical protein
MTQFTCKGVKQINNRISLNMTFTFTIRISAFFVSAGVPNGEIPEILIAKCRMELINHKNDEMYAITQRTSSKVTI